MNVMLVVLYSCSVFSKRLSLCVRTYWLALCHHVLLNYSH